MKRRVAVLMGGWSAEREVSLTSGGAVAEALESAGFAVSRIDVVRDLAALLDRLTPRPDVIFNALHGRGGEDGTIQGALDLLGIPYTHSGVLASAVAMDKRLTKAVLAGIGVRSPEGEIATRAQLATGDVIDPPYVLKPLNEGSSVGVRIVGPGDNGRHAFDDRTWTFGDEVLVEKYIPGRDLTVGVMGDADGSARALTVTEIRPHAGFYDYAAKYTDGRATHLVPAPIPPAVHDEAMRIAVLAHRTLGCRGITRSDFRFDDSQGVDGLYFLEINTQPGMTSLSLVPEQAAHLGIAFRDLVVWMVENASCPA